MLISASALEPFTSMSQPQMSLRGVSVQGDIDITNVTQTHNKHKKADLVSWNPSNQAISWLGWIYVLVKMYLFIWFGRSVL
jgi:hypothetical protein